MIKRQGRLSRRHFVKTTVAAGAAACAPWFIPERSLGMSGTVAPSDRIVMGGIGVGNRGRVDLKVLLEAPDVQFVADCDVQQSRRQLVKDMVDKAYGNSDCQLYRNHEDILDRDDIDAVLIATGDRWHTPMACIAAAAGKDIYSEKPCSMTIAESRALADTINRYGRVYQAGTQRRNIGNFMLAVDMVRRGKLGKLTKVHANTLNPATHRNWLPAQPEPPVQECDWDRWLGPCPWRPYNEQYVRGRWRGHFDFHGGGILEWGSHTVDLCQWGADRDHTTPVEYIPDGDGVIARYEDGIEMIMRTSGWLGLGTCSVRFEGEDGWVETGDSGQMAVYPDSLRAEKKLFTMRGTDPLNHLREFLDCVKTRAVTKANADVVARSHVVCHAAYIAWQLGRTLQFDPKAEQFVGDEEANRMCSRAMRAPYRI